MGSGRLSFDELFKSQDDRLLVSTIADAVWDHYGAWLDYSKLPVECQTVVLTRAASGLVGNGSFFHLFESTFNGDPEYVHTIGAYERIGLRACGNVLRRVLAFFPNSRPPDNQETRLEVIGEVDESIIDPLEKTFYECDAALEPALARYIRQNRDAYQHLFIRTDI
jgi:hypothetical protein